MGYQLVASALQPHWARVLTTTERLTLVVMCQVALDDESTGMPPRTYWGGADFIILQIRGELPPAGTAERRNAYESVRRTWRRLEEVGAIKRSRVAVNGMRSEYEITVNAPPLPGSVDKSRGDATSAPLVGGAEPHL